MPGTGEVLGEGKGLVIIVVAFHRGGVRVWEIAPTAWVLQEAGQGEASLSSLARLYLEGVEGGASSPVGRVCGGVGDKEAPLAWLVWGARPRGWAERHKRLSPSTSLPNNSGGWTKSSSGPPSQHIRRGSV